MANEVFSEQDHELLGDVARCLRITNSEDNLQTAFNEIIRICKSIGTSAKAQDAHHDYRIDLVIDHQTDPQEVRLYINEKLRTVFGQFWASMIQGEGKTDILVLTEHGYRLTTPDNLNRHRKGGTSPAAKGLASYTPSSFHNIHTYLAKFLQILQPTS